MQAQANARPVARSSSGLTVATALRGPSFASNNAARRATIDRATEVKDIFESLAFELKGYDDLHASARLRRDLLRRIGPVVVEEALRCAA